jgi:hypothetical protein
VQSIRNASSRRNNNSSQRSHSDDRPVRLEILSHAALGLFPQGNGAAIDEEDGRSDGEGSGGGDIGDQQQPIAVEIPSLKGRGKGTPKMKWKSDVEGWKPLQIVLEERK